jgi:hypothetical protein
LKPHGRYRWEALEKLYVVLKQLLHTTAIGFGEVGKKIFKCFARGKIIFVH